MTEKPILFFDSMVRAILSGEKTMTRRVVKCHKSDSRFMVLEWSCGAWWPYRADGDDSTLMSDDQEHPYNCPYGNSGDRLWVRETFAYATDFGYATDKIFYRASYTNGGPYDDVKQWKPSIHMPRWASRITLEITAVRVERLQDITEIEATHEGIDKHLGIHVRDDFSKLWDKINGKRPGCSWTDNPYVWCMSFKRI